MAIHVSWASGYQEPIIQREGALNLCMYADSTCCQMALAQNSLYGKCYNSRSTSSVVTNPLGIPYMSFLVDAIR